VFALTREVAARVDAGPAGARLAGRLVAEARAAEPVPGSPPGAPAHRIRVFVYDCCDPPFTTGHHTVLDDLIRRAGGDNVFGDLAAGWTHVSWRTWWRAGPSWW